MKPYIHAKSSAKKYGGIPDDYLDIHQFMDSSKASLADVRHRALLHSSFGCFVAEQVFGVVRTNSDGKEYSVRDVAEDHCIEDLGFIPSVERWLGNMKIQDWMGGPGSKNDREKRKFVPLDDVHKVMHDYIDEANAHRLKLLEEEKDRYGPDTHHTRAKERDYIPFHEHTKRDLKNK